MESLTFSRNPSTAPESTRVGLGSWDSMDSASESRALKLGALFECPGNPEMFFPDSTRVGVPGRQGGNPEMFSPDRNPWNSLISRPPHASVTSKPDRSVFQLFQYFIYFQHFIICEGELLSISTLSNLPTKNMNPTSFSFSFIYPPESPRKSRARRARLFPPGNWRRTPRGAPPRIKGGWALKQGTRF